MVHMGGKMPRAVDAESVESPFSQERDSQQKGLSFQKIQGLGCIFAPVSINTFVCACALRYVPGTSDDEKKNRLEIASKEGKEKTGKIYGVLGSMPYSCQAGQSFGGFGRSQAFRTRTRMVS
jgi:hypothetical protein